MMDEGIIRYELFGKHDHSPPLDQLVGLGKRGKLAEVFRSDSPFEIMCGLEDDLVRASSRDNSECEGWHIAIGETVGMADVECWLEKDGWIFIPLPAEEAKKKEADILVIPETDFVERFVPQIKVRVAAGDDSALRMNQALREITALDGALGKEEDD